MRSKKHYQKADLTPHTNFSFEKRGVRVSVSSKVYPPVKDILIAEANLRDMSLSEVVAHVLEEFANKCKGAK